MPTFGGESEAFGPPTGFSCHLLEGMATKAFQLKSTYNITGHRLFAQRSHHRELRVHLRQLATLVQPYDSFSHESILISTTKLPLGIWHDFLPLASDLPAI